MDITATATTSSTIPRSNGDHGHHCFQSSFPSTTGGVRTDISMQRFASRLPNSILFLNSHRKNSQVPEKKVVYYKEKLSKIRCYISTKRRQCKTLQHDIAKLNSSHELYTRVLLERESALCEETLELTNTMNQEENITRLQKLKNEAEMSASLAKSYSTELKIKQEQLHKHIEKYMAILSMLSIPSHNEITEDYYDDDGMNHLHHACNRNDQPMIMDLLERKGSRRHVIQRDSDNRTPLHYVVTNETVSLETVSKLIAVGKRPLVLAIDTFGENALFTALHYNVSIDVLSKLIYAGGKKALLLKNGSNMQTILQKALQYSDRDYVDLISKMIHVGGLDLIMQKDMNGRTVLHSYVNSNELCNQEIIAILLKTGRKKLVLQLDFKSRNVLQTLMESNHVSLSFMKELIEIGGRELLANEDYKGNIALHNYITNSQSSNKGEATNSEVILILLLEAGIEYKVGGEFGIGGLFNISKKGQNDVYTEWDRLSSTLYKCIAKLKKCPPILHSAILHQAPNNVLDEIMDKFDSSFTIRDSKNRLTVVVSVPKKRNKRQH